MDYSFYMNKRNRKVILPVIIEQDEDGTYLASVPSLQGCHTQGETLEELNKNLQEVVELCMEMEPEAFRDVIMTNRIVSMQPQEFIY